MASIEDHHHDPLHLRVSMADGDARAAMTLAAGFESCLLATGETLIRHAGVPHFDLLVTYNAQQAALCGAAHFEDEPWGKSVLRSFLQADPDARRRAIEGRLADEATAALSQFDLPLRQYDVEVDVRRSGSEVEARVDLTHRQTGVTISVKDLRLNLDSGEVMTPTHPDHEGTAMLLFP